MPSHPMQKKTFIAAITLLLQGIALTLQPCQAAQARQADDRMMTASEGDTTVTLLSTLEDGPWPCCYYLLDSNEELAAIPVKEWAGRCADETDWVQGWGPLSNSPDQFLTTPWASTRQALLVRRHFTLTREQIEALAAGSVSLVCSYDENPRVYVNGTLVWNVNGWNDNAYARFAFSRRQKALLREGDNVVAVSLQRGEGGGHIDMGLYLNYTRTPDGIAAPSSSSRRHRVYRLDGTAVPADAPLSRGIYILDGRKVRVKSEK